MADIEKITLKNGEIRYGFQVYVGVNPKTGKQATTERRFKTKREANIALKRIEAQVAEGTYFKIETTKQDYTFKEVYDKWNNEYKFTVAELTHLKTTSNFTNRILPEIGHFKLNNITHDDIQMLTNKWKDYTNCKVWIRDISRIFKYGIRHNYTKHNPADHVVIPKKKAKNKDVKLFYEKSELKLIVKQLEELDDPMIESYMRLLIFGGLRNGEVLGLRWSRIDFDNNLTRIDQAVGRRRKGKSTELYIKDPKNEPSHRTISIDDKTIEILTDLKEITGSSGLVSRATLNCRFWAI